MAERDVPADADATRSDVPCAGCGIPGFGNPEMWWRDERGRLFCCRHCSEEPRDKVRAKEAAAIQDELRALRVVAEAAKRTSRANDAVALFTDTMTAAEINEWCDADEALVAALGSLEPTRSGGQT